jgi:hypothetical protein
MEKEETYRELKERVTNVSCEVCYEIQSEY